VTACSVSAWYDKLLQYANHKLWYLNLYK